MSELSNTSPDNKIQAKFAKDHDLDRINFILKDRQIPNLSNKSCAVLQLYVSLSKLGYIGVMSCSDMVVRTLKRNGYTMSTRTYFRAISELVKHDCISRRTYRIGNDKFGSKIVFNISKYSFWFKSCNASKPCKPFVSHISSHVPICLEDHNTTSYSSVLTSNNKNIDNKPRARARAKYKNWIHPVLYSLIVVLRKNRVKDREYLISRARYEIESDRHGIEIIQKSGVDWDRPSWQEMNYDHREYIIRNEIIPSLRMISECNNDFANELVDIVSGCDDIEHETYQKEIIDTKDKILANVKLSLSNDELKILEDARNRSIKYAC